MAPTHRALGVKIDDFDVIFLHREFPFSDIISLTTLFELLVIE
jgi:hypothetical protein